MTLKPWVIERCPRLGVTTHLTIRLDSNDAFRQINERWELEQRGNREFSSPSGRQDGPKEVQE